MPVITGLRNECFIALLGLRAVYVGTPRGGSSLFDQVAWGRWHFQQIVNVAGLDSSQFGQLQSGSAGSAAVSS